MAEYFYLKVPHNFLPNLLANSRVLSGAVLRKEYEVAQSYIYIVVEGILGSAKSEKWKLTSDRENKAYQEIKNPTRLEINNDDLNLKCIITLVVALFNSYS